ncbi:MAG TPA: GDSL-type esterase/lipase family protein [Stellaceae bacterium]|nr:GDSL-type esterase/lipase family protein [Stellaceae bacterium]
MMRRVLLLLPGLAFVASLASGGEREHGAAPGRDCGVPRELVEDEPRLPGLAERLHAKQPVVITVIGGGSTTGAAAGGPANAYPHWLEAALRRRHPQAQITVINLGIARQTTEDMVQRFAAEIYPSRPNLVIWETGTVDAVRGTDIDDFTAALESGIAALREHNSEVMLVDMQYNSGTASVINFEPYLDALHQVADLHDVYLFRRFDIMRYWSAEGMFDFVDVSKENRAALAAEVYECLGENLAEAVDFAAQ